MLQIAASELRLAISLGRIRRPPLELDGPYCPRSFHQLAYQATGNLVLRTTDQRVVLTSRLDAKGMENDPWQYCLEWAAFDALSFLAEGSSWQLNHSSPRCLRLEKRAYLTNGWTTTRQFPLFRVPCNTPMSPPFMETANAVRHKVTIDALIKVLRFLVPQIGDDSPSNRLNVCSLLADGTGVSHHRRVFFRTTGLPLPAPIHLLSSDAHRLLLWLRLMRGRKVADVETTTVADPQGKVYHRFLSSDKLHTADIVAAPSSLPLAVLDRIDNEHVAAQGTIARKSLRGVSGFFRVYRQCRLRLDWEGLTDTPPFLRLKPIDDDPKGCPANGGGVIPVNTEGTIPTADSLPSCVVSPMDLFIGLQRHKRADVRVRYLPERNILILATCSKRTNGDHEVAYESVIQIRRSISECHQPLETTMGRKADVCPAP